MRLCTYQNHYHRFIKFITFNSTEVLLPTSIRTQLSGGRKILCVVLLVHYSHLSTNFWKCYMCMYGKYILKLQFSIKNIFPSRSYRKRGMDHSTHNSNHIFSIFHACNLSDLHFLCPQLPKMQIVTKPWWFSSVGMSDSLPLSLSLFTVLLFTLLISVHAARLAPNLYNFSYLHMWICAFYYVVHAAA